MVNSVSVSIREQQHSLIRRLADQIESSWNQYLQLEPYHRI